MRLFKTFCLFIACVFAFAAAIAGCENRPLECSGDGDLDAECDGPLAEAKLPISGSAPATVGLAISDNGGNWLPGGWRANGIVYNDAAPRCVAVKGAYPHNEYALVKIAPFTCPTAGEVPAEVTLQFTTTEWDAGTVARFRSVLQDWDPPPAVCVNGCNSTSHVGFKYRKSGVQWAALGASGVNSDVSSAFVEATLVGGEGLQSRTLNATSVLLPCVQSGGSCSLRFESHDPGLHYWLASTVVQMHVACVPSGPPATCGDGAIEGSEACDDGNATNGDGCSGCVADNGYTCTGEPSVCVTSCGDGIVAGAEQCDLGTGNGTLSPCSALCETQLCTTVTTCE